MALPEGGSRTSLLHAPTTSPRPWHSLRKPQGHPPPPLSARPRPAGRPPPLRQRNRPRTRPALTRPPCTAPPAAGRHRWRPSAPRGAPAPVRVRVRERARGRVPLRHLPCVNTATCAPRRAQATGVTARGDDAACAAKESRGSEPVREHPSVRSAARHGDGFPRSGLRGTGGRGEHGSGAGCAVRLGVGAVAPAWRRRGERGLTGLRQRALGVQLQRMSAFNVKAAILCENTLVFSVLSV